MKQCPKGNDPLTNDPKHCGGAACSAEVQYAYIGFANAGNGFDTDYYLEWQDKEQNSGLLTKLRSEVFTLKKGLTGDDYAEILQDALETFPNGVLNGVTVSCSKFENKANTVLAAHLACSTPLNDDTDVVELKLDFTNGPQGNVNGLTQHVVRANNLVKSIPTVDIVGLSFTDGTPGSVSTTIPAQASASYIARNGLTYAAGAFPDAVTFFNGAKSDPMQGNQENSPCSNRGLCDYSTGTCTCFAGYTREDCSVQNALAM